MIAVGTTLMTRHLEFCARLLLCTALSGCGGMWQAPRNTVDLNSPAAYMLERQDMPSTERAEPGLAIRGNAARCTTTEPAASTAAVFPKPALPLSPGDLIRISLPGDELPAGNYKVDSDGAIFLAGLGKVPVIGRDVVQVEAEIAGLLVAKGIYRPGHAHVSLRLLERDAVRVLVAGAVFAPGQVVINERPTVPD